MGRIPEKIAKLRTFRVPCEEKIPRVSTFRSLYPRQREGFVITVSRNRVITRLVIKAECHSRTLPASVVTKRPACMTRHCENFRREIETSRHFVKTRKTSPQGRRP